MRARRSSIADLLVPGGWSEQEVSVGGRTFRLLTPADPDEFLNHLVEPIDTSQPHLADPYWAKLWPAATYLAEAVLRSRESGFGGRESRVRSQEPGARDQLPPPSPEPRAPSLCLELGCGSGLVGLAALAVGWEVTFSDYVPQAVELALENAARNGLARAKGLVLDWRSPPALQFPFIMAADVTYDRTNLGPLLDTVERMLAPGGEAWFGDAGRGPVAEFLQMAKDRGWLVNLFDENDRPADVPVLGHCQRIVLRRAC